MIPAAVLNCRHWWLWNGHRVVCCHCSVYPDELLAWPFNAYPYSRIAG